MVASLIVTACNQKQQGSTNKADLADDASLVTVGALSIRQSDLAHYIKEHHENRFDPTTQKKALAELVQLTQFAQAAKDDHLENDAAVRVETLRVLANRYKEKKLRESLKEINADKITRERLKEIYDQNASRYISPEKREVAVLWLDHKGDDERKEKYVEKLNSAKSWLLTQPDVINSPQKGFSIASIDHSEHVASRYKGGVIGWLEAAGGFDAFTKACAQIAFQLPTDGAVSDVIVRNEGVFLVRLIRRKNPLQINFDSIEKSLLEEEMQRLRRNAEHEFVQSIEKKYQVQYHPVEASQTSSTLSSKQ
jgi:hypothetical protein